LIAFLQLLGGLVLLIYAGDALVRGAVSMAQRLDVPPMIVGLTVIAFGTSAPELMVGIDAVLTNVPTLALGNVVGSNIANIWLVIGLPALIAPMVCSAPKFSDNMLALIIATLVFMVMAFNGEFTALKGVFLLAGLFAFLFFSSRTARRGKNHTSYLEILEDLEGVPKKADSLKTASLIVLGGLIGLSIGAHFFVLGAVDFARMLGVSEAIIGLTLVALGTSIPELVTAIAAAMRRHSDLAIGTVIGSNIFNLLGIIGVSSLLGNIPVPNGFLKFDLWIMLGATLSFLPFAIMRKNITRITGAVFFLAYIFYIIFLTSGVSAIDYPSSLTGLMG